MMWYLKGVGLMALILSSVVALSVFLTWLIDTNPALGLLLLFGGATLVGGWFVGHIWRKPWE